jgi:membrane-bound lytic murein transglycosylase D
LHILAAYNFGENNLARALRRAQTRDIWPLFVHRRLPYQTRDYLIKMVTLWIIVTYPERFQFAFDAVAMPTTAAIDATPATRPVEMAQRTAQSEN